VKGPRFKVVSLFSRFFEDASGQTTVEYILLLAIIVGFFMVFFSIFKPIANGLISALGSAAGAIFSPEALHQFKLKK